MACYWACRGQRAAEAKVDGWGCLLCCWMLLELLLLLRDCCWYGGVVAACQRQPEGSFVQPSAVTHVSTHNQLAAECKGFMIIAQCL